jgi:polyhydroxyalkanoate synthesis regulator phasin
MGLLFDFLKVEEKDVRALLFGSLAKARETAEERLDDLIREGEERAREWKEKLIEERKQKEEKEEKKENVKVKFQKFLSSVGVVTEVDLNEIEEKLDELTTEIERSTRRPGGKKKKTGKLSRSEVIKKAWETRRKKMALAKKEEST